MAYLAKTTALHLNNPASDAARLSPSVTLFSFLGHERRTLRLTFVIGDAVTHAHVLPTVTSDPAEALRALHLLVLSAASDLGINL